MKRVGIAKLKAHLSEYLRAVRNGQTVTVLDRETPVAEIVPVREHLKLRIRNEKNRVRLGQIPLPPPLPDEYSKLDVVEILLEQRQNHR